MDRVIKGDKGIALGLVSRPGEQCSAMGFRGCTQETPNLQPQET